MATHTQKLGTIHGALLLKILEPTLPADLIITDGLYSDTYDVHKKVEEKKQNGR